MGFLSGLANLAGAVSGKIDTPRTAASTTIAMQEKASGIEVDPKAPINWIRNLVAGAVHVVTMPAKIVTNTALAALRLLEMPPIALGQGLREVSKVFSGAQRNIFGATDGFTRAVAA